MLTRMFIQYEMVSNEARIVGYKFIDLRMYYATNLKYFEGLLIVTAIIGLFLQIGWKWKLFIVGTSIIGFILYYTSFAVLTPW